SVAFEILPADELTSRRKPSTFAPAPTKSSKKTRRLPSMLAPERVATALPKDLGSAGSAFQVMRYAKCAGCAGVRDCAVRQKTPILSLVSRPDGISTSSSAPAPHSPWGSTHAL